jgi:hypothetical protein
MASLDFGPFINGRTAATISGTDLIPDIQTGGKGQVDLARLLGRTGLSTVCASVHDWERQKAERQAAAAVPAIAATIT